jgi:hypothetical protein
MTGNRLTVDEVRTAPPEEVAALIERLDVERAIAEERAGDRAGERQRIVGVIGRVLADIDRREGLSPSERAAVRKAVGMIIARIDEVSP